MERAQIVERHRLDFGRAAAGGGAVAVRCRRRRAAETRSRRSPPDRRAPAAAASAAPCAAVRARSAGNVGRMTTSAMSGSASREPRDRHRQAHRRVVERADRRQRARRGTRSHRRARAPTSLPAPSSSIAAVMLATPNLPGGSAALPRTDDQVDLRERHFVLLDDPDRRGRSTACASEPAAASAPAAARASAAPSDRVSAARRRSRRRPRRQQTHDRRRELRAA